MHEPAQTRHQPDPPEDGQWSLTTLVQLCRQESLRYLQRMAHDPRYCFELFRRAIVERSQEAWASLFTQYTQETPLVRHWVEGHPLFRASGEELDYFINRAFEKMWAALTPEKFSHFSDLATLLRYLKLCVNSAITDHLRRRATQAVQDDLPLEEADNPTKPVAGRLPHSDAALARLEREELWNMIESRLNSDQERTALYCRFDAGMKPAEIYASYPALFADVKDVYRVLQNALNRLRHDPGLLTYLDRRR